MERFLSRSTSSNAWNTRFAAATSRPLSPSFLIMLALCSPPPTPTKPSFRIFAEFWSSNSSVSVLSTGEEVDPARAKQWEDEMDARMQLQRVSKARTYWNQTRTAGVWRRSAVGLSNGQRQVQRVSFTIVLFCRQLQVSTGASASVRVAPDETVILLTLSLRH